VKKQSLKYNFQFPISNFQLITNAQYPITKQKLPGIISRLVIRSLVIGYYLVIGAWLLGIANVVE